MRTGTPDAETRRRVVHSDAEPSSPSVPPTVARLSADAAPSPPGSRRRLRGQTVACSPRGRSRSPPAGRPVGRPAGQLTGRGAGRRGGAPPPTRPGSSRSSRSASVPIGRCRCRRPIGRCLCGARRPSRTGSTCFSLCRVVRRAPAIRRPYARRCRRGYRRRRRTRRC